MKRKYTYSILIGSISGSIIPVIGSFSASNKLTIEAIILFLIMTFWQISHFYSIAILNYKDYKIAKIPLLPIQKGILVTQKHIIINIIMFMIMTIILFIYSSISFKYLIFELLMSFLWLITACKKKINDYLIWSKNLFILSLIVITIFNILIYISIFKQI